MLPYNSYRSYLTAKFGSPVLKVTINGGFSCPNRDGRIGGDGCSFCDNRSFSPAALMTEPPRDQLQRTMSRAAHRYQHFIAYLQPFSNTYGTPDQLRKVYEPLITVPGVVGLAVGTRPDCIDEPVADYLESVSKRTYLSVELGLQSADNAVLKAINRGHDVEQFVKALELLHSRKIETVAHVMLGLPLETGTSRILTSQLLAKTGVSGVKIHQLMIVKGTSLENDYEAGAIGTVSLEQYARMLGEFLENLRPDQLIHRIMADASIENGLIAPLWSAQKGQSVNFLHNYLLKSGCVQGKRFM